MERDELIRGLGLPANGTAPGLQLFMVSIVKEHGYLEAFNWLAKQIP